MHTNIQWRPQKIILHLEVKDDPDTAYLLSQCQAFL